MEKARPIARFRSLPSLMALAIGLSGLTGCGALSDQNRAFSITSEARALLETGDAELALVRAREARYLDPSLLSAYVTAANALLFMRRDEEAFDELRLALDSGTYAGTAETELDRLALFLADLQASAGDLSEAEATLAERSRVAGLRPDLALAEAWIQLRDSRPEEALATFDRVAERVPLPVQTRTMVALAAYLAGERDRAHQVMASDLVDHPEALIEIFGAMDQAGNVPGFLDFATSVVQYESTLEGEVHPARNGLLILIAEIQLRGGRPEDARLTLDQVGERTDLSTVHHCLRLVAMATSGQTESASVELLELAQENEPGIGLALDRVAGSIGPDASALHRLVERALTHGDSSPLRLFRARLDLQRARFDDVLEALKPILDRDPNNVEALRIAANARFAGGAFDEGIAMLLTAQENAHTREDRIAVSMDLGAAYLATDQTASAATAYRAALDLDPGLVAAIESLSLIRGQESASAVVDEDEIRQRLRAALSVETDPTRRRYLLSRLKGLN